MSQSYLIALGSNMHHRLYGSPHQVVRAAMEELSALGTVTARSPIITSDAMGAAQRRFANAACTLDSELAPPAMLDGVKRIEREFGRRGSRRWGDRVLDCDIILWSGGRWRSRVLTIPHRELRNRAFVLTPASAIAPNWRDPVTGANLRQLKARLTKGSALPR